VQGRGGNVDSWRGGLREKEGEVDETVWLKEPKVGCDESDSYKEQTKTGQGKSDARTDDGDQRTVLQHRTRKLIGGGTVNGGVDRPVMSESRNKKSGDKKSKL